MLEGGPSLGYVVALSMYMSVDQERSDTSVLLSQLENRRVQPKGPIVKFV